MTVLPDIEQLDAPDLLALKAVIDERLAQKRKEHIAAAEALGLTLVDSDGRAPRKRRASSKHSAE